MSDIQEAPLCVRYETATVYETAMIYGPARVYGGEAIPLGDDEMNKIALAMANRRKKFLYWPEVYLAIAEVLYLALVGAIIICALSS